MLKEASYFLSLDGVNRLGVAGLGSDKCSGRCWARPVLHGHPIR